MTACRNVPSICGYNRSASSVLSELIDKNARMNDKVRWRCQKMNPNILATPAVAICTEYIYAPGNYNHIYGDYAIKQQGGG